MMIIIINSGGSMVLLLRLRFYDAFLSCIAPVVLLLDYIVIALHANYY